MLRLLSADNGLAPRARRDIAAAVVHFASDRRSGKSTGNILNVDGGVPAAYTR